MYVSVFVFIVNIRLQTVVAIHWRLTRPNYLDWRGDCPAETILIGSVDGFANIMVKVLDLGVMVSDFDFSQR